MKRRSTGECRRTQSIPNDSVGSQTQQVSALQIG
jgi:hypothetical protein